MRFPVDLLADVSQAELERSAHNYMNNLLYSNPDSPEHLTLSDSTQVTIDISSVGFIPLYGSSDKQRVLALFSPGDPLTAVALYLLDRWWAVDDILRTADTTRDGAMEVETIGERIVLYILNRVIYRVREMSSEELPFLCHGEKDYAKILWNNGEAVGFYSVKLSGSLFNAFSTRSYQLPVMDSIFVRKCQRGKGFGLGMLEDFVLSFKEEDLGLRYPLTKSMYKVCERYLCQYPGDTELLWEVEATGGQNQRTNIARKIRAMDMSAAVSKSLPFTEESLVITEVTEKDAECEEVTTQIKEAESMECTVEIVEEVTVLRTTKVSEAEEVPVVARGRSSGSKRRNTADKITADRPEKVIRIEDIEAETPREQQISDLGRTALHNDSELEQSEGMLCGAAEDLVETTPGEEAGMILHKPASGPASQELEEDVALAVMVEPQIEEDITQDGKNTPHDTQIMVENVASEIEEAEEHCQKEDTAVNIASDEVLEVHKQAETLDEVGARTEIEASDENTASDDGEAEKTVKSMVENKTPRRRSQRHCKPQEREMEETAAQDGGRMLRGRTVKATRTPKQKYTRHSQKECEEQEEIKENEVTVEVLPEEETQKHEDEHLTNVEQPVEEDSIVEESSTELLDAAKSALTEENKDEKVTGDSEKEQEDEQAETSVGHDKQQLSESEVEKPPVVQRRALRARNKVSPKPKSRRQSKRHQTQEEQHSDEADLGAEGSAKERADKEAVDKQMEEHHQVEQDETVATKEEEIPTKELTAGTEETIAREVEAAEDVRPPTEVNVEESIEVQEDEEAQREMETESAMEADEDKAVDVPGLAEDTTVASASETVVPDEEGDEAVAAGEPEEKDTGSEIPKLQKATVILVDLKTASHHLSMDEAEEKTGEPEILTLEEEGGEKQENIAEESVDATTEAEIAKEEVLVEDNSEKEKSADVDEIISKAQETPVIETRVLRSGRKITSFKQQDGDKEAEEVDKAVTGTIELEGTMEAEGQEAVPVPVALEEEESAVSEICADTDADLPRGDDTGVEEEEADEQASVEKTNEEREEKLEDKEEKEEAASERDESIEPEIDVLEGQAVPQLEQNVVEEQSEGISKTNAEMEAEASSEECDEKKPVMECDEVELPPAAVTRSLRSGGKTPKAPPKARPRRSKKQNGEEKVQKKTDDEVEEEEHVTAEVEKGEEEAMIVTNEEEDTADAGGETHTPLANPDTDSAIAAPSEEDTSPSAQEQQSGETTSQFTDLQRVTVVLMDLQKAHHEVHRDAEATDADENQMAESMTEEEPMAEEHAAGSPAEMEVTELDRVVVEEGGLEEKVENVVTAQEDTGEGSVEEAVEEEEPKVSETRKRRGRKPTAKATPRRKSARSGRKREEKEMDSEISEGEPEVQVRLLRGGRKSISVPQRCTTRAQQQLQREEGDGGEESTGVVVREAEEEEQHHVIGEKGESIEEKVATPQQADKTEPEMDVEEAKEDIIQEAPEEGQASGTEAAADRNTEAPAGQSTDERTTSDDVAEEEVTQDAAEDERSVSTSETLPTAKGGKASEEDTSVIETGVLRSEETAVSGEPQDRETRKTSDDEQDVEAAAEKSTNAEPKETEAAETVVVEPAAEAEQPAVSQQGEASVGESADDTPASEKCGVTEDEEAPVVTTRVLRSGEKAVKGTPRFKSTKEGTAVESTDTDEPPEPRALRRGRRSAPATPRPKSKRGRTQCQPEDETEGQEEEAEQELPQEKEEQAEKEEGESRETSMEKHTALEEEEEVESGAGGDPVVGDAEQMKAASTEGTIVPEKADDSITAVDDVKEETASMEKFTELESNTASNKEEAPVEDVCPLTDDSTENKELNAEEQAETEETASTGQDAGPPAEDTADDQVRDNSTPEPTAEEMESAVHVSSEDQTLSPPAAEGRNLRRKMKNTNKEDDNTEEGQLSMRRSVRKRPRVDYRENDEDEEGGENEAATNKEEETEDNKKAERADEQTENLVQKLEKDIGVIENTSEKGDTLNLVLDSDEEVETAAINQEHDEDKGNDSEEEVEPIVIAKKILRGRSVPSVIITPRSKPRHLSAQAASDEERGSQSAQKRQLRKRKSTEVTPAHKSKRHSRV